MATTFTKIATVTVGSGGASAIEFTSISSSFNDLALEVSIRSTRLTAYDYPTYRFNGSSSNYSYIYSRGTGSSSQSGTDTNISTVCPANSAGANIFSNDFIYVSGYASSNYKTVLIDAVEDENQTTSYAYLVAGLWSNTSAITSIKIENQYGVNWSQYSTATLYGIKNS